MAGPRTPESTAPAGPATDPRGPADAATLNEPLTIADASRRVGVHPNTVRRLIRTGRIRAQLVRGRHGDTWLVDATELDAALGRPPPAASKTSTSPTWDARSSDETLITSATDLSLDRARALERYTHGLLQPLVDLLREREAALESRDALLRTQAERIGRLEREVELLREERLKSPARRPAGWGAVEPRSSVAPPAAPMPASAPADRVTDPAPAEPEDGLPQQVFTLAGQVGRLRADLQLIAAALQGDRSGDVDAVPGEGADAGRSAVAAPADLTRTPSEVSSGVSPVTPEELAGLFPVARRGKLTLEPLGPPGGSGEAPAPVAPPRPSPSLAAAPADDPFRTAEAAVEELRRKLASVAATSAAAQTGQTGQTGQTAPAAAATPSAPVVPPSSAERPGRSDRSAEPRRRRWWFW